MISVKIETETGIALLEPDGSLTRGDFENVSRMVDGYIEQQGHLNGIIIRTKAFPGWDSFAALVSHLRFVKEHHEVVPSVAVVTDSRLASLAKALAQHFLKAEIRLFPFEEYKIARQWVIEKSRK